MSTQVKLRRGSTNELELFTPALAEIVVDTTKNELKLGDGVTVGGLSLARAPVEFATLRELLNTDLVSYSLTVGDVLRCVGRTSSVDGGGSTFRVVPVGGSIDYETVIPLTASLNAELLSGPKVQYSNGVLEIVAHRGFAEFNVEGSMYAFTSALAYGADALECDIQVTSDGELVLFHDELTTTNILNNITGGIKDNTYAQVQAATYKILAGNILENKVGLAKFSELLDYVALSGCRLHAEIKVFRTQSDIALMVNEIIAKDLEDSVVLHSFRLSDIQYVRAMNTRIKVSLLVTNLTGNDRDGVSIQIGIDWLKRDKLAMAMMSIVAIDFETAGYSTVKDLQQAAVEVGAWTAESEIDVLFARRNNVNTIISDYPVMNNRITRVV